MGAFVVAIRDAQLHRFISQLASTTKRVDDNNIKDLAAAVGDRTGHTEAKLRRDLEGKTRSEQFGGAKPGVTARERDDLRSFLANASRDGFTLTPKARNFVEALAGLATLDEEPSRTRPALSINSLPPEVTADPNLSGQARSLAADSSLNTGGDSSTLTAASWELALLNQDHFTPAAAQSIVRLGRWLGAGAQPHGRFIDIGTLTANLRTNPNVRAAVD